MLPNLSPIRSDFDIKADPVSVVFSLFFFFSKSFEITSTSENSGCLSRYGKSI